jgi:hypothetical protein
MFSTYGAITEGEFDGVATDNVFQQRFPVMLRIVFKS